MNSTIKVMKNKARKKNKTRRRKGSGIRRGGYWREWRRKQKRGDDWEHRRGTEEVNC